MRLYLSSSSHLKSSYTDDAGQTLYVVDKQHKVATIKKNLSPARTSNQPGSSGHDPQLAHLADIKFNTWNPQRLIFDDKEHEASEFLKKRMKLFGYR